ncbi:uncharacterized protein LOC111047758 isoform X3 [Nilaparvata lugens]|uniref:uncharacterized protein LOC111047758 isoform X3 n=1 Tax=Nilaparvata lugens TaxID=108931 RepID=UPI00193CA4D1|nr:uncharacterized protein LOC111047758 isoform X3 [Nilaparvata lugens]
MAEQLDVGRAEPELDKESIQSGSGSCVFNQSEESSGGHVSALVKTASPEPTCVKMAKQSEPELDKEPIQSVSGSCVFDQSEESSGGHVSALVETASPEPISFESMDFVGSFPEEVTDMILSLLSSNDLEKCSSVSQLWSSTIKRFQKRQISRLKSNWENGKYSVHCFPISNEFSYLKVFGVVDELASNYPYDQCPYFFAYATEKGVRQPIYFSVVQIDAELRKTINHFQYTGFDHINELCIMGGSIIWISFDKSLAALHYYNALLAPNTEMKTIDRWNTDHIIGRSISPKMDRNYIAVSNNKRYVKAWCIHTLELKFEQKYHAFYSQHISLFDGCLVISNSFDAEPNSVIEIHNLKRNNGSTLKYTLSVDGGVESLHSNRHFIYLIFKCGYKFIQVISKQSYSIIFSHKYDSFFPREIQRAHDDYIVVKEVFKHKYRILNLVTGKWSDIPYNAVKLWTVFDNIAVIRNLSDKALQVFDWERNTQLLTLAIPDQISDEYVVASVTEMRIVIVDTSSNQVVVFKFG